MRPSHALVVAVALLLPVLARAEEAPPTRWYGWQLMLADAASISVMVVGAAAESDGLAYAGLGAFAIGGPVIHLAHDRRGHAALSGLLRSGLPLGFGAIASAACEDDDEPFDVLGCAPEIAGAALGGAFLAMVIDYAFLSHEARPASAVGVAVAPRADGGVTVAIAGAF